MTAAAEASRRAEDRTARGEARRPRSLRALVLLALIALSATAGLAGLGIWQVERRAWKLDLIARVDRRVHAAPSAAPGPAAWPAIGAENDEYRHVRVGGRFLAGADTLVKAVTERGGGYWVMTPFRTDGGFTVLVNRGFVPADAAEHVPPSGATVVTGLLRITEPGGAFLHRNDPAAGRWYSRDVGAIAAKDGLSQAAPYFIDADAGGDVAGGPVGGLTVIAFPNNHLVYALTWFGLAAMTLGWGIVLARDEWRLRRSRTPMQDAASPRKAAQGIHADS